MLEKPDQPNIDPTKPGDPSIVSAKPRETYFMPAESDESNFEPAKQGKPNNVTDSPSEPSFYQLWCDTAIPDEYFPKFYSEIPEVFGVDEREQLNALITTREKNHFIYQNLLAKADKTQIKRIKYILLELTQKTQKLLAEVMPDNLPRIQETNKNELLEMWRDVPPNSDKPDVREHVISKEIYQREHNVCCISLRSAIRQKGYQLIEEIQCSMYSFLCYSRRTKVYEPADDEECMAVVRC